MPTCPICGKNAGEMEFTGEMHGNRFAYKCVRCGEIWLSLEPPFGYIDDAKV